MAGRKKWAATLASTLFVAASCAAVAWADSKTYEDEVGETGRLREQTNLDIVSATASHTGAGKLKHTVTMRGGLKPNREYTRPFLFINRGDGDGGFPEWAVVGKAVFRIHYDNHDNPDFSRVGSASLTDERRTWTYKFDAATIDSVDATYGWRVQTKKGLAEDRAPFTGWVLHNL